MKDLYIYKTVYNLWYKSYKNKIAEEPMLNYLKKVEAYLDIISNFLESLNLECDEINLGSGMYQFSFSAKINLYSSFYFLLNCKQKEFIFYIDSISPNRSYTPYSSYWNELAKISGEIDRFKKWLVSD